MRTPRPGTRGRPRRGLLLPTGSSAHGPQGQACRRSRLPSCAARAGRHDGVARARRSRRDRCGGAPSYGCAAAGPRAAPRLRCLPPTLRGCCRTGKDVSRLADVVTGGAHVDQRRAQRRASPLPVTDATVARFVAKSASHAWLPGMRDHAASRRSPGDEHPHVPPFGRPIRAPSTWADASRAAPRWATTTGPAGWSTRSACSSTARRSPTGTGAGSG